MGDVQGVTLHLRIEDRAQAVVIGLHRVDVMRELVHVLGQGITRYALLVRNVEVRVEVDDEMLLHKGLAAVGHILCLQGIALQVLELLPLIEVQQQVHLVMGGLQSARIRQDDVRLVHSVLQVVDDDIVEHTCVLVLLLYIQVDVLDAVIKYPFGNLQFWRFHLHRGQQLQEVLLRFWRNLVLKVERPQRHQGNQDDEWSERSKQRNACRLDGQQLQPLADVPERDEAGQQDGEWQRHRNEGLRSIEEELGIYVKRQALSYQVIDIFPQKLHHHDKKADAERACKQREEVPQNERVESLDESHVSARMRAYNYITGCKGTNKSEK